MRFEKECDLIKNEHTKKKESKYYKTNNIFQAVKVQQNLLKQKKNEKKQQKN